MKKNKSVFFLLIIFLFTFVSIELLSKFKYPPDGMIPDWKNPMLNGVPFSYTPFAPTFRERQLAALRWTAEHRAGNLDGEIARALLGEKGSVSKDTISSVEKVLSERNDCADFTAIRAIYALYVHEKSPFFTSEQFKRVSKSIIDFKYWFDEPGKSKMIFWTENHQIIFHASEYLAGQFFPDETFSNNGKTGKWHMEHAKELILKWMERRARWGFSEWDANPYYDEDLIAVVLLAEYARDEDISKSSAIIADLILFDIACDLFHGIYGTSHGRAYEGDIMNARNTGVSETISILSGSGTFRGAGGMSGLALSGATRYIPSDVIIAIAEEDLPEFLNYERHGIPLENLNDYDISYNKIEDWVTLTAMGIYSQPEVIDLFIKVSDKYNLWDAPYMAEVKSINKMFPRDGNFGKMRKDWEVTSDRTLLGEVNKVTYRTPDYMLSSAQSYRPGEMGNQHHIWQASLSPDAIVFTTNPGSLKIDDDFTPTYWAGQNRLPRAAQYKNLAFIIYNINLKKAIGEQGVYDFSHAFFPMWAFEEVIEKDGWIFGRVGDGYIALYSSVPYEWKNSGDPFAHDATAKGTKNIWICHMGNKAQYGEFKTFIENILSASKNINLDSLSISYEAPGIGNVSFSWEGTFLIDGKEIPLNNYMRVENPYCRAEFDKGIYEIKYKGRLLTLDFFNRKRVVSESQ